MKYKYKKLSLISLIVILVVIIDQLTKSYMLNFLEGIEARQIKIFKFLSFSLVWNFGISFGVLNQATQNQLVLIFASSVIIGILLYWAKSIKERTLLICVSLIVGGAIGNIIDRIVYGAVVDFIDVHYSSYHFPAFNIADSCIVIGAIMMLLLPTSK